MKGTSFSHNSLSEDTKWRAINVSSLSQYHFWGKLPLLMIKAAAQNWIPQWMLWIRLLDAFILVNLTVRHQNYKGKFENILNSSDFHILILARKVLMIKAAEHHDVLTIQSLTIISWNIDFCIIFLCHTSNLECTLHFTRSLSDHVS